MAVVEIVKINEEVLEETTKKLRLKLKNYREVVILLYDTLLWKEVPWHPLILFAVSTVIFLLLWIFDFATISLLCFLGMIVESVDYAGPIVVASLFPAEKWNGAKEKQFEQVCNVLAVQYLKLAAYYEMKHTNPRMFYPAVIGALFVGAFLGSEFNNTLFTYLLMTGILLYPGFIESRSFEKCFPKANQYLLKVLGRANE